MFCWIGEAATRRPRLVLFGAFVFLVLCVALGAGAGGRLKTQGYDDPRSDSSFAARVTAEHLGAARTWSSWCRCPAASSTTPPPRGRART